MRELRLSLLALTAVAALAACASGGASYSSSPIDYPPPPGQARLQLLARYTSSEDLGGGSSFERFVVGDVQGDGIYRAHGVAWDRGRLLVVDPTRAMVHVLNIDASSMSALGGGQASFKKPIAIAVAPDGWKYVTDTELRRVAVFDSNDAYAGAFGNPESWKPVGVAADAQYLWVSDAANYQLVQLDRRTGAEVRRIGREGSDATSFFYPLDVTLGPSGDVYVADSFNTRIHRIRPDGTFVRSYGTIGKSPGQFARPKGVAVDREGRIYAVDAAFENVQILDAEGRPLLYFGRPGGHAGAINMPADVHVSYDAAPSFADRVAEGRQIEYVVFVTSHTGANMVNVYGFLKTD